MEHLCQQAAGEGALPNAADLQYFIAMQEAQPTDAPDHSAEKWNRRAEAWEKARTGGTKGSGDDRIQNTVDYLRSRGLLTPDQDVADIGCGPGRFAAAFAQTAHWVTGFDISENMVRYGMEHAAREGRHNVTLRTCDFQTMDLEAEGLAGAFDLVFSSLTPAIHGMKGLEKSMAMSRAYCCNITHISSQNQLRIRMMREVFHREPPARWNGRWFYSLFNVLYLMGYYPEVTYYNRHQEYRIRPDRAYAELMAEHLLPPQECTERSLEQIWSWLQANTDSDGRITEITDTCYGRTLWDVRRREPRPDYRAAN